MRFPLLMHKRSVFSLLALMAPVLVVSPPTRADQPPAPVVGFMSTAPKAAAFAVLLRVVFVIDVHAIFWVIWVSAALSMTLGNVSAMVQNNASNVTNDESASNFGIGRQSHLQDRGE